MEGIEELLSYYKKEKKNIKKRLEEFKENINKNDREIFAELAFCICTPQSKATLCWKAVEGLAKNKLLYIGDENQIKPFLNAVRFGESKAGYIVHARKFFSNEKLDIRRKILQFGNSFQLREWLVDNVKGLGLKESSHFIRNVGFDYKNQLAILDRHILKNLERIGIIKEIPKALTERRYLEIEDKIKKFSEKLNMPLYELDLLLWSKETGIIFK